MCHLSPNFVEISRVVYHYPANKLSDADEMKKALRGDANTARWL